jgi:hypothetical protein
VQHGAAAIGKANAFDLQQVAQFGFPFPCR